MLTVTRLRPLRLCAAALVGVLAATGLASVPARAAAPVDVAATGPSGSFSGYDGLKVPAYFGIDGAMGATAVTVTVDLSGLPAGSTALAPVRRQTGDVPCAISGLRVTCSIAQGTRADYRWYVWVQLPADIPAQPMSYRVSVSSADDPDAGNDSLTVSGQVLRYPRADIGLAFSGGSGVLGGPVSVRVTVTNHGPDAGSDALLELTHSASGLDFLGCTAANQAVCTGQKAYAVGESATMTLSFTITAASVGSGDSWHYNSGYRDANQANNQPPSLSSLVHVTAPPDPADDPAPPGGGSDPGGGSNPGGSGTAPGTGPGSGGRAPADGSGAAPADVPGGATSGGATSGGATSGGAAADGSVVDPAGGGTAAARPDELAAEARGFALPWIMWIAIALLVAGAVAGSLVLVRMRQPAGNPVQSPDESRPTGTTSTTAETGNGP